MGEVQGFGLVVEVVLGNVQSFLDEMRMVLGEVWRFLCKVRRVWTRCGGLGTRCGGFEKCEEVSGEVRRYDISHSTTEHTAA